MTVDSSTEPSVYVDNEGRRFEYVHIVHPGSTGLGVHFSAFFGKWGDAKPYRDSFQGYFHRLKMLGTCPDHDWLFLCDPYGVHKNGTYYTGEHGDLFVERAMLSIIDEVVDSRPYDPREIVTVGSSMGATAALKFGLLRPVGGIVAICPHIDLDVSAAMQGRAAEVAFITTDGEWGAEHNFGITRQLRGLVGKRAGGEPPPTLFVQSCADDVGVYAEQVLPFVEEWRERGGNVHLDVRAVGGHTSDFATKPLLLDAVGALMSGRTPDIDRYQHEVGYVGTIVRPPFSHRVRSRLHRLRARLPGADG